MTLNHPGLPPGYVHEAGTGEYAGTEFRVYECPGCRRLWVIIAATDPVDHDEHDFYIHRNMLGNVHFSHHQKSYNICPIRPQRCDRPDVLAAYHMGGNAAVDAMGGVNSVTPPR